MTRSARKYNQGPRWGGPVVGASRRSQQVVVVEHLGVLTALPQPEETEVEVHLYHLFTWRGREGGRERKAGREGCEDGEKQEGGGSIN